MLAYDVYSGGVSLKQPAQGVKQMSYETADALVSERIAGLYPAIPKRPEVNNQITAGGAGRLPKRERRNEADGCSQAF